jgi:DNA-directed RNA polymerase subunit alpha
LELPSQVNVERSTLSATYGKFTAEPFERGFGATIGNSLRRVLLSSLEGSAITQIKIRGAQHEFSSMPNVLEDVTEIVLNVKSLVVKNHSENTRVLTVLRSKAGPITGADVQTDSDVEIINKDHVIATLTGDTEFMMEMVVENGRGYLPASEQNTGEHEIGIIPVDAAFSPVVRVRYTVEETRVGQKTNFDRLVIEIWTDGSVQPELAMVEGAKILRKHLNPFVQSSELGRQVHAVARGGPGSAEAQLENKLNMLVSDLVQRSEDQLLEVRNFGETTLFEVNEKLKAIGLHLGYRVPSSMR